jgi:hypothetical protein
MGTARIDRIEVGAFDVRLVGPDEGLRSLRAVTETTRRSALNDVYDGLHRRLLWRSLVSSRFVLAGERLKRFGSWSLRGVLPVPSLLARDRQSSKVVIGACGPVAQQGRPASRWVLGVLSAA